MALIVALGGAAGGLVGGIASCQAVRIADRANRVEVLLESQRQTVASEFLVVKVAVVNNSARGVTLTSGVAVLDSKRRGPIGGVLRDTSMLAASSVATGRATS
jgi:hypothetical protein